MKKAFLFVVLAGLGAGMVFSQNSTDFTVRTRSFNGELGVVIMGYNGTVRDVVIPSSFNGIPVMEIGDQSFMLSNITSVIIPRSVVRIGRKAFSGNKLDSVSIPDSVREIGENAFDGNLHITGVPAKLRSADVQQPRHQPVQAQPVNPPVPAKPPVPAAKPQQPPPVTPVPAVKPQPAAPAKPPAQTAQAPRQSTSVIVVVQKPRSPAPPSSPAAQNTETSVTEHPPLVWGDLREPVEERAFETDSTPVFTVPDESRLRQSPSEPIRPPQDTLTRMPPNENIPQRYAKAPAPLSSPERNYSAVIPSNDEVRKGKFAIVGTVPQQQIPAATPEYSIATDAAGVSTLAAYGGTARDVVVPSSVGSVTPTVIGKLAYWNRYITSVKIPDTIIRIEDSAFSSNSLTEITIPSSVKYIGYQAFNGNPLQRITIGEAVPMQSDSFPALFSDFYRINGMIAGNYYYTNGKWFIDR